MRYFAIVLLAVIAQSSETTFLEAVYEDLDNEIESNLVQDGRLLGTTILSSESNRSEVEASPDGRRLGTKRLG